MKIYTKQGDDGGTRLVGGARVSKDDVRIEAYGTIDELSAALGVAISHSAGADTQQLLETIQDQLFVAGSELATKSEQDCPVTPISPADIRKLEDAIDRTDAILPKLSNFILPGGTAAAAALHMARTVCRRGERRVVTLSQSESINPCLISFLNRLGDLLFVLARAANVADNRPEIIWQPGPPRPPAAS